MTTSVAEEMAVLLAENRRLAADCQRMRAALTQIASRTMQRDLNQLAHQALGHQPNPWTVRMLTEIERERRSR